MVGARKKVKNDVVSEARSVEVAEAKAKVELKFGARAHMDGEGEV